MLILELKEGEAIQISDAVVIRFSDSHKKQIKVAIEASIDVPVVRAELLGELEYEYKLLSLCQLIMASVYSYGADFQKGLDAQYNLAIMYGNGWGVS